MSRHLATVVFCCLCLCMLYAGMGQAAAAGDAPRRLAANAACSEEAKASNNLQLAQARMQAARADLNLSHGGHCRANALKLMQYAYRALEALQKQENGDRNAAVHKQRLQAIHDTMNYLRSAEQAVQQSLKNDPQGAVGVDVTALDNAMHALDDGYHMAAGAETPPK